MKNLESNKIVASILLSGLIAMLCGFFTNLFYNPDYHNNKRGYQVAVVETSTKKAKEKEEPVNIVEVMKLASLEKGKSLSKKCTACHSFNKGGPNKVGPNLWNIIETDIAAKPGYTYSKALAAIDGVWTYDAMYQFLNKPKKYAPGTKMSFIGFKKPKDIASMIEFLRSNSDNPAPLPN
ncbi:MAG: cytochrome c family protein [Rickettsiales bacterium]|nr:cytochrome c family protein [Rickettsiales bacterium]